jgi:phenylacetate-coenzyme A ligase PaaK-like adenylate-forming protein
MAERVSRQSLLLKEVLDQAARCPIYRGKIPPGVTLDTLDRMPVLHYPALKEAVDRNGWEGVLGAKADHIFETSGSVGDSKRIPFSNADLDHIADDYALLMEIIGLQHADVGWNFGGACPLISGEVVNRTIAKIRLEHSLSTLLKNDTDLVRSLKQASRLEKIDAMAGSALLFFLIARICNDQAYLPGIIRDKLKRTYHLPGPLASLVSKVILLGLDTANLRRLARGVRTGISYAEPLTAYREELAKAFPEIRMVDLFGSTENPIIAAQIAPEDAGLCLFTDPFIAELAPPDEVHPSIDGKGLQVHAVPWWNWAKGMRGELVLTRPGECLPLIRYATGDMLEVLDPEHEVHVQLDGEEVSFRLPLVKVLGRAVDVLDYEVQDESGNFLGNKVFSRHISDALQGAQNVRWWELYVVRGRPGRLVFVVIPINEPDDPEAFRRHLFDRLVKECQDPLHTFQVGEELGYFDLLVAPPGAYSAIQEEIDRRMREGRPIGQLKPKRIRPVSEDRLPAVLAERGLAGTTR